MMTQPQFAPSFMRIEFWRQVVEICQHKDFAVQSEGLRVMEAIFMCQQEDFKQYLAEFISEQQAEILQLFSTMIQSETFITKIQGMKLLHKVLSDPQNEALLFHYLQDSFYLKEVLTQISEEEPKVQSAGFALVHLIVTSRVEKGYKLTETLKKNSSQLKEWIEEYKTESEDVEL